jgi:hypothetical protein
LLAVSCLALHFGAAIAEAQQSSQSPMESRVLLTALTWKYDSYIRHFDPNGMMNCALAGRGGHWQITGNELIVRQDNGETWFFLVPIDPKGMPGNTQTGKKAMLYEPGPGEKDGSPDMVPGSNQVSQATPTPAAQSPVDVQQGAASVVQAHHDSLVFVTGSAGAGSGFILKIGSGGNFLITNVHVAAGIRDAAFKNLDGQVVQTGVPSMAVGEDIFCMSTPAGTTPFEMMQDVGTNAAVGDDVVVLGNAEGGGVINTIMGKIVGIGPNLVEVDAPFVPGNSGSPIVHVKSGKVIGVATYLVTQQYDLTTDQKLPQPVVRRFGYRIDAVKNWQPVNWRAFCAQAEQMESVEALTSDLSGFITDLADNKGKVLVDKYSNPIIKERIDEWISDKGPHASAQDREEADENFISYLKVACQTGIPQAQQQITYDYFRRELNDEMQGRQELSRDFQQIIQVLQN